MNVVDRVEANRAENILLTIKIFVLLFIILIVIMAITAKNVTFRDFRNFALPVILLTNSYNKFTKQTGQFIEWRADEVEYKSKDEEGTVEIKDIKSISIHLDNVILESADNTYKINIEDYKDYETRLRIKENFTKLENETLKKSD